MSLKRRLANQLIFANTRHPIDPQDRKREVIPLGLESIEAWVVRTEKAADLFCLKFPGNGGRAELAGPHPCELLAEHYEVWTINPPGYGTSSGEACVTRLVEMCDAAWQAIQERAAGKPILVTGNSLGGMYALYVAAHHAVAGLCLRNPAPIHQLIRGKYSWWNAGLGYHLVGSQVPSAMDAVANAARCSTPTLFVMSARDKTIPPRYQQMIVDAYGGPLTEFIIPDADHHHPVPEQLADDYRQAVATWARRLDLDI